MTTSNEELRDLVDRVGAHYAQREFSALAVSRLQFFIRSGVSADALTRVGSIKLRQPIQIGGLGAQFPVPAQPARIPEQLKGVQAIFAFAFGYRFREGEGRTVEDRLPGANNRALAGIAATLRDSLTCRLCAQFEIADALDAETPADIVSPRADLGTDAVVQSFVKGLNLGEPIHKIAVVAHEHHMARCLLVLSSDFDIQAVPAFERYSGYDPAEAQPRVVSSEEFIVSDFVSMATHSPWLRVPTYE